MFNPSRDEVRRFFCGTWKKQREGTPLSGAEIPAAEIIARHPEYHVLLTNADAATQSEWNAENGQMNPFLHLSMHLAIAEQISIDQPSGIRAAFNRLCAGLDRHEAEHILLDCLGEALWHAQRQNRPIDGTAYLECLQRAAGSC